MVILTYNFKLTNIMKNIKIYTILALILCVAGNLNAQVLSPYSPPSYSPSPYLTTLAGVDVHMHPWLTQTDLHLGIEVGIDPSLVSSVKVSDTYMGNGGNPNPPPLNGPITVSGNGTGAHPLLWTYERREIEYSMYIMFTVTYSSGSPPVSFGCIVTVQPL